MEEDIPRFTCKRCGFYTEYKRTILKHLTHTMVCSVKEGYEDIEREILVEEVDPPRNASECHQCDWCNKLISKTNFSKHRKVCKQKPDEEKQASTVSNQKQTDHHVEVLMGLLKQKDDELITMRKELDGLKEENKRMKEGKQPQAQRKHAKGTITAAIKILCWDTHVGKYVAATKCLCCKNIEITQHNHECGHIVARSDGGTLDVDNLRPICHKCNNSMGSMNMIEFMAQHGWTL